MKKLLIALFGAALILGACGAADEPAPAPDETPQEAPADDATDETPQEAPADDATDETAVETFDAARAESAYQQTCQGCHGGDLQGGGVYPHAIAGLSYDDILEVIHEGQGTMPPGLVQGDDAENLAAWIAAQ